MSGQKYRRGRATGCKDVTASFGDRQHATPTTWQTDKLAGRPDNGAVLAESSQPQHELSSTGDSSRLADIIVFSRWPQSDPVRTDQLHYVRHSATYRLGDYSTRKDYIIGTMRHKLTITAHASEVFTEHFRCFNSVIMASRKPTYRQNDTTFSISIKLIRTFDTAVCPFQTAWLCVPKTAVLIENLRSHNRLAISSAGQRTHYVFIEVTFYTRCDRIDRRCNSYSNIQPNQSMNQSQANSSIPAYVSYVFHFQKNTYVSYFSIRSMVPVRIWTVISLYSMTKSEHSHGQAFRFHCKINK